MLIPHIWFVFLLECNAWCASATEDPLVSITLQLLESVFKTQVAFYISDDYTCSEEYRDLPGKLIDKGVLFQRYDADKANVVPSKHVFIIGCFEFIQNIWKKLLAVLTPSHTVAVISKDYTGTGKFMKKNSHVGIRLIVVTHRTDGTWIIRRIIYNFDKISHYVQVATVPGSSILPSKQLYPIPKFNGWNIRIYLQRVKGNPVLCHEKWWRKADGRIQDSILLLLAEYMKICYDVKITKLMPLGKFKKTSRKWTGTLGYLQRNEIDVAGKVLVLNSQRASHFDMTDWFDTGKVQMTGPAPYIMVKPFIVFEVFTIPLWIFTACSVIVLSYLRWLVQFIEFKVLSTVKEDPVVRKRSRVYYFMQTFSMLVWRGIPETRSEERMWGLRVSTVITSMMVFILMAVYCNNITSFLAVPQMSKPINSVEDLFTRPEVIPMIRPGNSHYRYIHSSKLESMKKLKALMDSNKEQSYVNWYASNISQAISTGTRVYISSYSYAKYIASRYKDLNLHVSTEHFKWDMYSLGFAKNSPFTARVNLGIQRIKQFGLMVHVMKTFDLATKKPSVSADELVLGLQHLQGVFYILFVGVTVSIIAFVGEKIHKKTKVKRK